MIPTYEEEDHIDFLRNVISGLIDCLIDGERTEDEIKLYIKDVVHKELGYAVRHTDGG